VDIPEGFTETITVPGMAPLPGLALSHEPPEVIAENDVDVPVIVRVSFCDGGVAPPL
jgi:hypothetical protein